MTIDITTGDSIAVMPIVDYEPPARGTQPYSPPSHVPPRRPGSRAPRRHAAARPTLATAPALRRAAAFADAALRRVLEVIDRRRPVAQLRPLLAAGLVDSVLTTGIAPPGRDDAAVLRRVRLQPVAGGSGDEEAALAAAEVFATYRRGQRIHAIACRVERVRIANGIGWQVVALHIG